MKDPMFDEALSNAELSTWKLLKSVVTNFLRNHQSAEYEKEIEEPLKSFHQLGAQMSVKLHFLWSHLDYFLKNCRDLSKDQDICFMEECYQGQWDVTFSLSTAGAWNGMHWVVSTGGNPWIDLSSMNSFFCVFFCSQWHNVSFLWIYQPSI